MAEMRTMIKEQNSSPALLELLTMTEITRAIQIPNKGVKVCKIWVSREKVNVYFVGDEKSGEKEFSRGKGQGNYY